MFVPPFPHLQRESLLLHTTQIIWAFVGYYWLPRNILTERYRSPRSRTKKNNNKNNNNNENSIVASSSLSTSNLLHRISFPIARGRGVNFTGYCSSFSKTSRMQLGFRMQTGRCSSKLWPGLQV